MNKPELYAQSNEPAHRDAEELLQEFIHLIQWNPSGGDRIMDVGCGPGDVTVLTLLPQLPPAIGELVGTDKSTAMLQYASAHYQHAKVTYDVLDIATKELPNTLYKNFDHVFSFYCLHWVQDQRQAMVNIYNLLQPGGDVLLMYLANHPVFDVFLELAEQDSWRPYMRDASRTYVAVHQHVPDVEGTVHAVLQEVGFQSITCVRRRKTYSYGNVQKYTDVMTAVNPLILQLPEHLKPMYLAEFVDELKNQILSKGYSNDTTGEVCIPYSLIFIYATKPQETTY